jgi:hypothetical protein
VFLTTEEKSFLRTFREHGGISLHSIGRGFTIDDLRFTIGLQIVNRKSKIVNNLIMDQSSNRVSLHNPPEISRRVHVEDQDGDVVFTAHSEGSEVHDL